jgi:hypothetical protein
LSASAVVALDHLKTHAPSSTSDDPVAKHQMVVDDEDAKQI